MDWRGRGGYVVAPPSRHASGHPYQWIPGRGLEVPPGQVLDVVAVSDPDPDRGSSRLVRVYLEIRLDEPASRDDAQEGG